MHYILFSLIFGFILALQPLFTESSKKTIYQVTHDLIDVVIPCTVKDLPTLNLCIEGIRNNGKNIRRIIVVSDRPYTNLAEWFDEKLFPFTKLDIATHIFGSSEKAKEFLQAPASRIGWIYQQFLKIYAPLVIPGISSNVLILDADTIFLNPVAFLGPHGEGLYNPTSYYHKPCFDHAKRVLPWFTKVFPQVSGVSHHMLFQREPLMDLLRTIESLHKKEAWKALCELIDQKEAYGSCMSEYEMYFNFIFLRSDQMKLRKLQWADVCTYQDAEKYKREGYHFVSCHSYLRPKNSRPAQEVFTKIYEEASWGKNQEGAGFSGGGSLRENAAPYIQLLDNFLRTHSIKTVVDVGCGDWELSQHMNWSGIDYAGYDVVQSVIEKNKKKFSTSHITFAQGDLTQLDLPPADLLICKDVLQHLPHEDIFALSSQFYKFKYCLITNDIDSDSLSSKNEEIRFRGWHRTLDLSKPPFNMKVQKLLTYKSDDVMKQVVLIKP